MKHNILHPRSQAFLVARASARNALRGLTGGLIGLGIWLAAPWTLSARPGGHDTSVKLASAGTISHCSPSWVVQATPGSFHTINTNFTHTSGWRADGAAALGCRVEAAGATATIIAGPNLKSGSFRLYYEGSYACGSCGTNTYSDFVVIDVVGDDESGEGGCGGDCGEESLGTASVHSDGVDFRLNLGRATRDSRGQTKSAGYLALQADTPTIELTNLAALTLPYERSGVVRVPTNTALPLQELRLPQGLVRATALTNGYTLSCYDQTQVDGAYNLISNASAFVTWTLTTVGGSPSVFQVKENRGGLERTHLYTHSANGDTNAWRLDRPDGSHSVNTKVASGLGYVETYELRGADGALAQRVESTYQYRTNLGEALLMQRVEGAGGVTQTNRYDRYPDDASAYANQLERVIHADGSWIYYVYDELGQVVREYSAWLGSPAPATGAEPEATVLGCRKTEYTYSGGGYGRLAGTTVLLPGSHDAQSNLWTLALVAQTDHGYSFTGGSLWQRVDTVAPGLITTTSYITNTADARFGQVESIVHPDGRLTVFTYGAPGSNGVAAVLEATGQPDGNGAVLNGEQTETQTDAVGRTVATIVRVIENGTAGLARSHVTNSYSAGSPDYTVTDVLTGRSTSYAYACCGLHSVTDPDGVVTVFDYDTLRRRVASEVRRGAAPGIKTTNVLDAAGRTVETRRIGTDATVITLARTEWDLLGRPVHATNALGGVTTNLYWQSATGRVEVTLFPDGGTRTNEYYLDGTLRQVTGSATVPMAYGRGVETVNGVVCVWTAQTNLNTDGSLTAEWTRSFSDPAGRPVKVVYAPGTAASETVFNELGQVEKTVDPDGNTTWFEHNAQGEREYVIVDVDQDGQKEKDTHDRVTRTVTDYLVVNAPGWTNVPARRTRVWQRDDANDEVLVSEHWAAVDGLRQASLRFGLTNQTVTDFPGPGQRRQTTLAPDGTITLALYAYGQLQSVTNPATGVGTSYEYDPHGRVRQVVDARNGATTLGYNAADLVTTNTTPAPGAGQSPLTTVTHYDLALRAWRIVQPDHASVTNEYFANGLLKKTTGAREYPVEYTYDYAGRKQTMKTWTNYPSGAPAVTTWNYDVHRGWLAGKRYADNTGPDYTYTAAGRLATRAWARGITTSYTYNGAGEPLTVDYSDATPAAAFGYDRRGRQTTITAGGITVTRVFNAAGQMLSEAYSGGPLDGLTVANEFDALLRRTNLSLWHPVAGSLHEATHAYDPVSGRLATVSSGTNTAAYGYLANSPLVEHIRFTNGATLRMTTTKQYDLLNRVTSIASVGTGSTPSPISSSYAYNPASQRTALTNADHSRWDYDYDSRGQVTSGKKYWADGSEVPGQQFGYAFDDIGNRQFATRDGRESTYTANPLNQYTSRTVPGFVNILGEATNAATVTVNFQPTTRQGDYFRAELAVANSSPLWLALTNLAVLQQGTNADLVATNLGHLLIPQTPETFTHDLDGNLTSDSLWTNVWNGENRRVVVESRPAVPTAAKVRQQWTFLPDGRWIERIVSTWNTNTLNYQPSTTNRYVWDGNVLLAVLNHTNGLELAFVRGLDLSGTMQGAGGVGGLLWLDDASTLNHQPSTHYAASDGNGNVMALVNAADGALSARYEYGPFGEPLRQTGPMAAVNPLRFSTQYADDWTGELHYLYRSYRPDLGRWPSRDPIGEQGGKNLLRFARNGPIYIWDALGLDDTPPPPPDGFTLGENYHLGGYWIYSYRHLIDVVERQQDLGNKDYYVGTRLQWDGATCRCIGNQVFWTVHETYDWLEVTYRLLWYKYKDGVEVSQIDRIITDQVTPRSYYEFIAEKLGWPYVVSGMGEEDCRGWQYGPVWPYGYATMPEPSVEEELNQINAELAEEQTPAVLRLQ